MTDSTGAPRDYYETLGVDRTATPLEIEAAFRELARKWHPDVCADAHRAAANFKLIAEAYDVLGNTEKRRLYDEIHRQRHRTHAPVFVTRHSNVGMTESGGVVGMGKPLDPLAGFHAIIESLLTGGWSRSPPVSLRPGLNVEAELLLTPEEACRGGTVEFKLRFDQMCPGCSGQGTIDGNVCRSCEGHGKVQQDPRKLAVRVPPGVSNGSVIHVRGEGKSAPDLGARGDLTLRVRIQPYW